MICFSAELPEHDLAGAECRPRPRGMASDTEQQYTEESEEEEGDEEEDT